MTQYIDKSAIIAKIEERRSKNARNKLNLAAAFEDNYLLSFLNTLEVKEVDLEKFTEKINTFQARYKHPEIASIKGAMAFMARMCVTYPEVAKEWYDSLPKATMD